MAALRIPSATYRLQFNHNFRFADARSLVPYLHELGVTDLYASPIFKARPGSAHGYDITDPTQLDPELGTEKNFDELAAELLRHRLGCPSGGAHRPPHPGRTAGGGTSPGRTQGLARPYRPFASLPRHATPPLSHDFHCGPPRQQRPRTPRGSPQPAGVRADLLARRRQAPQLPSLL
jgi:hypothetical protein